MAKQTNQVNRELKRLEAKQNDTSLLHVRELRGRKVNEESHIRPLGSLPQAQSVCIVQPKT